jgi:6-phosphogluconolactonase
MKIILTNSESHWIAEIDTLFKDVITNTGSGHISFILTGGQSAKKVYNHWSRNNLFLNFNVDFYFGDERCVPPDDPDSNYGMVMNTLFNSGIPDGCKVHRIIGEAEDVTEEINRYGAILPETVDVVLLSVGEDGHIASIFPGSDTITEDTALVCHVSAPKKPSKRFTISTKVLKSPKKIIVLACGAEKGKVVSRALEHPQNVQELPVAIVMGMPQTTILLDKEASEQLQ